MSGLLQGAMGWMDKQPRRSAIEAFQGLHEFVRSLNPKGTPDPAKLIDLFAELLGTDTAVLYDRDPNRRHFRPSATNPRELFTTGRIKERFERLSAENLALAPAIRSKKPAFIGEAPGEGPAELTASDQPIKCQLAIPIVTTSPLVSRDDVPSVLLLSWIDAPPWDRPMLLALATAAASVVSASYNFRLVGRRHEQHMRFLLKITDPSVSGTPDTLFHEFLSALSDLVPTKFVSLWLYDASNDALVMRSFFPPSLGGKKLSFSSFDQAVLLCTAHESGEAVKTLQPRMVDAEHSPRFANPQFARSHHLKWFISFPILEEDKAKPLGVVNLWPNSEFDDLDNDAISEANEYVQYMTNTIRTAMLLFEEKLFSAYDSFFTDLVKFDDNRSSWNKLTAVVRDQMGCAHCSIFLEDSPGFLRLKGTTGLIGNTPVADAAYRRDPASGRYEGLTGLAFRKQEPFVYHIEFRKQYAGIHISKFRETPERSGSIIFGQITDDHGQNIGVIRCVNKKEDPSKRPARFTREDVIAMKEIAQVVSNTYSKARLVWLSREEKDRNFRSLHHELIAPVDGLLAHVNWLFHHLKKPPSDWNVDRIRLKCDDMRQIGHSLDDVVQFVAPLDPQALMETTAESIHKLVNTCIGFVVNDAQRSGISINVGPMFVPRVAVNSGQMMRVLFNLLRNAVKYADSKSGGSYIRITAQDAERGMAAVTVEDNGVGFLGDEVDSVFEKFTRGSKAAEVAPLGEGLGLYYCREIISAHGGRIWIASPAKPTRICFSLRIAEEGL